MSVRERSHRVFSSVKSHVLQVNLFKTGSQNETIIQNQRRSTRLYLILLLISMAIVTTYYSVITYTKTTIIQSPSLTEYYSIMKETSLQCPCSNIAVKFEVFTEIVPHYHELCQSVFISDEWINYLFDLYQQSWNKSIPIDFRRIGVFQFQTLRSLCQLIKETIDNGLRSFDYTDFIQSHLPTPEIFQRQIDSFIKEFIDDTPKVFLRTLHFIQDTTAQSLFMTGASITSVRPILQYRMGLDQGIIPYPGIKYTFVDNSTCVCSSSTATTCMGLALYDNSTVAGFQTGCYMFSALMNSTLEAFHNQAFIDKFGSSQSFEKLNSSNSSMKIEMLLNQMFVKSWSNSTLYKKYFQHCAPETCFFTKIQHYTFLHIFIVLTGLFGGLSVGLQILTPILILNIWPILKKMTCQRRQPASQIVIVQSMSRRFY